VRSIELSLGERELRLVVQLRRDDYAMTQPKPLAAGAVDCPHVGELGAEGCLHGLTLPRD
jgi:hypothetical protein